MHRLGPEPAGSGVPGPDNGDPADTERGALGLLCLHGARVAGRQPVLGSPPLPGNRPGQTLQVLDEFLHLLTKRPVVEKAILESRQQLFLALKLHAG